MIHSKSQVIELLQDKFPGMEHYFINHVHDLGCGSYYCAGFVDSLSEPRQGGCWRAKYLKSIYRSIELSAVE